MPGVERTEIVVIGAGVVGCAVARRLASLGRRVVVLEQGPRVAHQVSGWSSGILHSGFHLDEGTLQARLCLPGLRAFHEFCHRFGVRHRTRGKLVIARTRREVERLEAMFRSAWGRGLKRVQWVAGDRLEEIEPAVRGLAGVFSPYEVAVDPVAAVSALAQDARGSGAQVRLGVAVLSIEEEHSGVRIETSQGSLKADTLVNAAGLGALGLAHGCGLAREYTLLTLRALYYCATTPFVRGIVHRVASPSAPFAHVHFERLADERLRIGPRPLAPPRVVASRAFRELALRPATWCHLVVPVLTGVAKLAFVARARCVAPSLRAGWLQPEAIALRPQLVRSGRLEPDFVVVRGKSSVHALNIGSPGFTASIPLADELTKQLVGGG